MASVLMIKDSDVIRVDASMVLHHQTLGWRLVENTYGADTLTMHPGSAIKLLYAQDAQVDTARMQHYQIAPAAASATGVHAAITLGAAAQEVIAGITDPDVSRTVTVKGNVSGITGDVVITGRNILGELIADTVALSGASEVEGVKAFATVEEIALPAQTHTPTAQVETATAAGTITGSGNATIIVTAAGMTGTPKTKNVAVLENDTAADWAEKVRIALAADTDIAALFTVGGTSTSISLTRKIAAANDSTLNIAMADGTCAGITPAASSANTTAGVGYDTVSVGIASKFGLPQVVEYAACLLLKLFDGSTDAGSLAVDADEVEKNLYSLAGTADGSTVLDLYYLA